MTSVGTPSLRRVETLVPTADKNVPLRQRMVVFAVHDVVGSDNGRKCRHDGGGRIAAGHEDERPPAERLRVVGRVWMPEVVLAMPIEPKNEPERIRLRMPLGVETDQTWHVPAKTGQDRVIAFCVSERVADLVQLGNQVLISL